MGPGRERVPPNPVQFHPGAGGGGGGGGLRARPAGPGEEPPPPLPPRVPGVTGAGRARRSHQHLRNLSGGSHRSAAAAAAAHAALLCARTPRTFPRPLRAPPPAPAMKPLCGAALLLLVLCAAASAQNCECCTPLLTELPRPGTLSHPPLSAGPLRWVPRATKWRHHSPPVPFAAGAEGAGPPAPIAPLCPLPQRCAGSPRPALGKRGRAGARGDAGGAGTPRPGGERRLCPSCPAAERGCPACPAPCPRCPAHGLASLAACVCEKNKRVTDCRLDNGRCLCKAIGSEALVDCSTRE